MILNEDFHLAVYWKNNSINLNSYLDMAYNYIVYLSEIYDEYELKILNDSNKLVPFIFNRNEFKELMMSIVYNSDAWYFDDKGNRHEEIKFEYKCDSGFYSQYYLENDGKVINVNIRGGQHRVIASNGHIYGDSIPNSVIVYFPKDNKLRDINIIQKVFKRTIQLWTPEYGLITSDEFIDNTFDIDNDFHIGWINYFKKLTKKNTFWNKQKIDFQNEGAIISFVETFPEKIDNELIQEAIRLRYILNKEGFLKWED